jgi:hypothetical protein
MASVNDVQRLLKDQGRMNESKVSNKPNEREKEPIVIR